MLYVAQEKRTFWKIKDQTAFNVTLFIFLGDEPHLQNTMDGSIGTDRLLRDMTGNLMTKKNFKLSAYEFMFFLSFACNMR